MTDPNRQTQAISWLSLIYADHPDDDDALEIVRAIRSLTDEQVTSIFARLDQGEEPERIAQEMSLANTTSPTSNATARHDRALLIQGAILMAVNQEAQELQVRPYRRNTPLAFGEEEEG